MTEYTIKPGQTNFRPLENPLPRCGACGFTVRCIFGSSCWFSPEDWGNDRDWHDWNKVKGLTWYFSPNNRHSVMIAWRPGDYPHTFEVCGYTNDARGRWQVTDTLLVEAGQEWSAVAHIDKRIARYVVTAGESSIDQEHAFKRPWLWIAREVGTSIGGANNEPGPYGGKATQEMRMEVDFRLI